MSPLIPVLITALLGCGTVITPSNGDPSGVLPHQRHYALPERHGLDLTPDAQCNVCHPLNGETTPPSCHACHADYPHSNDFYMGILHGPSWRIDESACVPCHGVAGDRPPANLAVGSCTGCHATFPHSPGWPAPSAHGAAVIARGGTTACQSCHGVDGNRLEDGRCSSCHADYPHPDDWIEHHGARWLEDRDCGESCHDPGSPVTCASCHDVYPHPSDWTGTPHISATQVRGEPACAFCHPAGFSGPQLPVSCAPSCHEGN